MENIFIATDFSAASRSAALYAMELAKLFKAKVWLFHAYRAPLEIPESYLFYKTEDIWQKIKASLQSEADIINPGKSVDVEICGLSKDPANAILDAAQMRKAAMIVCGMKKNAKGLRRIFGSTITALARKSAIPLLIIPEDAVISKPQRIALASDMNADTAESTVALLKEMAEKLHANLSVLWVLGQDEDPVYEMRYRTAGVISHLKTMDPVLEFPAGDNITEVLDLFTKDNSIDMMAIIPHKHSFLERLFTTSVTSSMIFQTHIPLLILPQKKIVDVGAKIKEDELINLL